eukprot:TRINITY_DN64249_c0_g1_i1.p1 TRINITY_DN64249_c0_g1~~TRINITY_DN64249_c0_g1_i1.p1  ORF type:complete len:550 (-),score=94.66 TRINITY_DN64249_c0_g1_i1:267-1916(-)
MPRAIRAAPQGQLPAPLKDPCRDRAVASVPPPPAEALTLEMLCREGDVPDLDLLRKHLELEGALDQRLVFEMIERAADLFDHEPNMLRLDDPITVVGDIHGQFWDLLKMFEVGGPVGKTQYLFLGDYVDRGSFSVEVAIYLFACKVRYPQKIYMLRGNHECRQMTSYFNFREECEFKYDMSIYNAFMEAFDTLPLCATINRKYFAVHGGISPHLVSTNCVGKIDRFQEPPRDGLFCDLIWADPGGEDLREDWLENETRGCSFFFSTSSVASFLKRNNLLTVLRAHEAQVEGYKMHAINSATGFPSVITVFSAPNYCDTYNNKAAVLKLDNNTLNVLQFNPSPHPYYLPNFMDVFAWSMPFLIEKVLEFTTDLMYSHLDGSGGEPEPLPPRLADMIQRLLSGDTTVSAHAAEQMLRDTVGKPEPNKVARETVVRKAGALRAKVRVVARMARMFRTLREENQLVLRLKGICPGNRIPVGLLLEGRAGLESALDTFTFVQSIDAPNEVRPTKSDPFVMTKSLSLHKRRERETKTCPANSLAAELSGADSDGE